MDAAKFKKLEEYAGTLGRKGAEEEKNQEYVGGNRNISQAS